MTYRMYSRTDRPTFRLGAAAALVLASACAAPILATETDTETASETATGAGTGAAPETGATAASPSPPVSCGVATETRAGTTTFRPWVRTRVARTGGYSFALAGPGTAVTQDGGFETGPARTTTLGEAVMTGRAEDFDAELTVTLGGTSYTCHADPTDI